MILIFKRVRCIARESSKIDSITFVARCNADVLVVGVPWVVLQILYDDAKLRAVVVRQLMQHFIANPQFTVWITETVGILVPRSIKIHRAILTPLHHRPGTNAFSHYRSTLMRWRNHVQTIIGWCVYLRAVTWESFKDVLVLLHDTFELLEEFRWWMLTSFAFIFGVVVFVLEFLRWRKESGEKENLIMIWFSREKILQKMFQRGENLLNVQKNFPSTSQS